MKASKWFVMLLSFGLFLVPAYAQQTSNTQLGSPLPGLTSDQLTRFTQGQDAFSTVEGVTDGLGPVFNDKACAACHTATVSGVPVVGGTNARLETRFGRQTLTGFDPLVNLGGSLIQEKGIGAVTGAVFVGETVPPEANVVAKRRTTPLFGLGLVDAVPDQAFQNLAALERALTPATAGTVALVTNLSTGSMSVGKFGWKDQNPTLFQFSGDAYLNEMGITNPQFPNENCPQGDCALLAFNPEPGLNDDGTDVQKFTDFMSFLAPPPRGAITTAVQVGESLFTNIGCANCHTTQLTTGPNSVPALNQVVFHPYSDFLLHDMGRLGDGITQGPANGRMMRTAPLWGLRFQSQFLHDGRASTITGAILGHAGQGAAARNQFIGLTDAQKFALLAFLRSL
ncbi:MAG TPA: di-heme oxidoredictase family protein [Terriglobales bacterium]|nr:di-heme oxidoredictase family protein [Terriglobales bacterium]